MTRIPELPALSGTPGSGSKFAYWSSAQDRTFQAGLTDLTGIFNEATGADVTAGNFNIMWHARTDRAG